MLFSILCSSILCGAIVAAILRQYNMVLVLDRAHPHVRLVIDILLPMASGVERLVAGQMGRFVLWLAHHKVLRVQEEETAKVEVVEKEKASSWWGGSESAK